MKRRVVITGMGAVTSVGNDVNSMWESLINGKNGIDFITQFDTSKNKVKLAGEVKNLDPSLYLDPKEYKRLDRVMLLSLIAATQAFNDSKLKDYDSYRMGTFVTSGIGGINTIYDEALKTIDKSTDRVSPFFVTNSIVNLVGGNIAIKYKAKGPSIPVVTACSAGTNAIGEAFRYIRDGYVDIAFAGGSESSINALSVGGFTSMRAISISDNPNNASIPFDKERNGFVMAEGSGILILEELEHAKKRNAHIYAELVGYASTCDAYHITTPDETAEAIIKCMQLALEDANISPDKIDYINPHATSTYYNDKIETYAIKQVFGEHAYNINLSGTKSMTGHALGAIGAIESIICVKAINESIIPPTINLRNDDPDCDLNYTKDISVNRNVDYAMSNNYGFGGQNAVLIFKKYQGE